MSQKKYIVIKIYNFSFLENQKLKLYFENNKSISSILLYISEKAIYNQSGKSKDNINQNIEFLIKDKNFIIFSEKSIQLLGEYNGISTKIEAISPNGLFLLENKDHQNLNDFNEYLFLFKKFNSIKYIEKYFSFLIDNNNIIIDFYDNHKYKSGDNLYIEKINKSNNVIKYLNARVDSITFVNNYYNFEFDNNIKNINLINLENTTFRNENGLIESRSIVISTSNNLEDILNHIKSIKIKKKEKKKKRGKK